MSAYDYIQREARRLNDEARGRLLQAEEDRRAIVERTIQPLLKRLNDVANLDLPFDGTDTERMVVAVELAQMVIACREAGQDDHQLKLTVVS